MFAISNKELERNPAVKAGQAINCPRCKKKHKLRAGKSRSPGQTEWKTSTLTLFYKCGGHVMLGAINGKLLTPEVSEKILNN